ncbi:transposase [Streptomyces olivochromogenes]|uniref:transposase n=1 Tax=Streptomyces olivochromogenes TaxID=1963 RepID=UPI0027E403ED|nr:transposase [Streptomyces olivochromogenes]MCF3132673.1 transposase [Streptomyces olivochromogenes]
MTLCCRGRTEHLSWSRDQCGLFRTVGRYGPFPQCLRERFEGVIWRFRTGSQWREMSEEFGARQTLCDRFGQRRDVGMFAALTEGMSAEAAVRGQDTGGTGGRQRRQARLNAEEGVDAERRQPTTTPQMGVPGPASPA